MGRAPAALARRDLLAGAHAVLGLEVDEHVGRAEAVADGGLEPVRDAVGVLERHAGAERPVQVDVG